MEKQTNEVIIYNFKNYLDKERLSDQIGYSGRFILNHLLNIRAALLSRKIKQKILSDQNYQTFTVDLVEVSDEQFPCIEGSKCILLRTQTPIPFFIDLKSITTPLNKTGQVYKISEINPDMIKYKLHSKLSAQSSNLYYYLQNTGDGVYVYIWSNDPQFLKAISIKGLFYKPYLVEAVKDCAGNLNPCYDYRKSEFPIDAELLAEMYNMALSMLLKAKSTLTDTNNEGLDSLAQSPNITK